MSALSPWKVQKMGDLVNLTSGQSPSAFRFGPTGKSYFKVDQLGKATKYLGRDQTPYRSQDLPEVPTGSVLIAKRGAAIALNRVRLLAEPGFMDTNVMALTPSGPIESEFLFYWLVYRGLWDIADVTSVPQINNKHINPLEIALPGIDEQRAIVFALKDQDNLIDSLGRLVAKKRDLKEGMLQELLSGRTRLPGFIAEWQSIRLGEHVTYVKSVALSRAQLDSDSPVRYLHYGDIHTSATAFLDAKAEDMPRTPEAIIGRAGRLDLGDLVLADASEDAVGVGKSVEIVSVPEDGVIPGLHTIAARFDKAVLADGFKAYLQNMPAFRSQLLALAAGTKVLATTRRYISSVVLSLPGTDEQTAIARALGDIDAEIQALERRFESARAIKQGMMQQLLTGRIRLPLEEVAA